MDDENTLLRPMPNTCQTRPGKHRDIYPGVDMNASLHHVISTEKKGIEMKRREKRKTGRKSPNESFDLNSTSSPNTHKIVSALSVFCDIYLLTYVFPPHLAPQTPHTPSMQLYHIILVPARLHGHQLCSAFQGS